MALVTRFDTPGRLRDFPESSPFYDAWHTAVSDLLGVGDIGTMDGSGFYNASLTEANLQGSRALVWIGFPRPLLIEARPRRDVFRQSDTRDASRAGRTTQVEYLEWFTQRDERGRITKVTFTTETPEYWNAMFASAGGPERVLELYRELLGNPAISLAEITDASGKYDPLNPWNTARGIIHYIVAHVPPDRTSPENHLTAAIGLAKNAVSGDLVSDNFQFSDTSLTAADQRVARDVGGLARKGLQITTAEPVGVYIGGWDDTGWSKPDGSPVDNYWRVVRPGAASAPPALRLEYEVPASEGFVVSDIRIGGRPIEFGGQIAEHLTVMIPALAGTLP